MRSNDLKTTKRDTTCPGWCEEIARTEEDMEALNEINDPFNKLANKDAKKAIKRAIKKEGKIFWKPLKDA
jgi:hypothetical protein